MYALNITTNKNETLKPIIEDLHQYYIADNSLKYEYIPPNKMSGCKNCKNLNTTLRTFEYKCCPKAKYKQSPYISSFEISLCDFCYEYVIENTNFPISGKDEYDAWDGLVFPENHNDIVKIQTNNEDDSEEEIKEEDVDDENFCGICHETYKEENKTFKLSCGHKFDTECIIDWLQMPESNGECPICRNNPHKKNNDDDDEFLDEESDDNESIESGEASEPQSSISQIRKERKKLKRYIGKLLNHELFKNRVLNLKLKKKELSNKIKEKKKSINEQVKNVINNIFTEEELLEYKQFEKDVAKLKIDMNKKIPKDNLSYPHLTNKGEKKHILNRRVDGSLNIPCWISYHSKIVRGKLKYPFNYLK